MRKLFFVVLLLALLVNAGLAQKKNWNEWSKEEAEKILNDSPWGQTQTDTDVSEMVYTPTTLGSGSAARTSASRGAASDRQSINNNRADRGATNQAVSVHYRVRLLSATPVRQAFMRVITLAQKDADKELLDGLTSFVQRDFKDFIVVAVTFESTDSRFSGPALQALGSARVGTLKNIAYLERKDGKRNFIMEYHPPAADGLGAKFIFPRIVDERPYLDNQSGSVRFYCELTPQIKFNVTFKLADMMYNGKLEY